MAKSKTSAAPKMDVGAATAALKAIPDGKVVDFISARLLDDTPEEYVRQNAAGCSPPDGARRRSQTAANLVDRVIPHVPARQ